MMYQLIKSNGKEMKEVVSNGKTIWRLDDTSVEKTGAELGLDQRDLIYSGLTTFRVSKRGMNFNLGYQDYALMKKKRLMVINGRIFNIQGSGVSNHNGDLTLVNQSWSSDLFYQFLSHRYSRNVGEHLYTSKDNRTYIELYK